MITREDKLALIALAKERARRQQERWLSNYRPYPKQIEFHTAGVEHRERLLMAGNQLGKTFSTAAEVAMHLTGQYPEAGERFYPTEIELQTELEYAKDPKLIGYLEGMLENLGEHDLFGADIYPEGWPGLRFDQPTWWWAASVSGTATRDNPQRLLIGPPSNREAWGTAAIPKANLINAEGAFRVSMAKGTPNLIDTMLVKHVSGGDSILQMKAYEQGRERWQGPTLNGIWFDEEPPEDIYDEGLTRTNTTEGPVMLSFTPLLGFSAVVRRFISIDDQEGEAA